MIQVTESLTRQVADLARLDLTDQELSRFTPQISKVLQYVELLQEAETEGVAPLFQPFESKTPLRKDEIQLFPKNEEGKSKTLDSAPETIDDSYKVPQIL